MHHRLFVLCLLVLSVAGTQVTYSNLVAFFNYTLDADHDGYSTLDEFVEYFRFMEPEHNLTREDLAVTFHMLDLDENEKVTLKELVEIAKIKINYRPGHKQIHLGLTTNDDEMQVMWVSNPEAYEQPVVKYGLYPSKLEQTVPANITTYNVGHYGFHGKIYRAVMKNLIHQKRYYYKVGDLKTGTYSEIKYFQAPP